MRNLLLLLCAAGLSFGCKKIDVENGKIPSEFLSEAQKFVGTYDGSFGIEKQMQLKLSLDGQKAIAQVVDGNGVDTFAKCGGKIGDLALIRLRDKKVKKLIFYFHAGQCELIGKLFKVEQRDGSWHASLASYEYFADCPEPEIDIDPINDYSDIIADLYHLGLLENSVSNNEKVHVPIEYNPSYEFRNIRTDHIHIPDDLYDPIGDIGDIGGPYEPVEPAQCSYVAYKTGDFK